MKTLRRLAVPALLAFAAVGMAADPIRIDIHSAFSGPVDDTSVMTVELQNDGPDARGALEVTGDDGTVSYPVELPQGARKQILTFPGARWGDLSFTLRTNRGSMVRHLPAMMPQPFPGGAIALIGDDSGGLAFVRKQSEGQQTIASRDAYVKPEEAPTRPLAYRDFSAVVLGPGAERASDETVDALKRYAIGGGTLVFFGGASAPILEDPRWKAVLPGRDWKPKTLNRSAWLESVGGSPVPGPFTILVPREIALGARSEREGNVPLQSERGFGLGSVAVLGYSPLEPPLSAWEGRGRTVARLMRSGSAQRARQYLGGYLHADQGQDRVVYYGATAAAPPAVPGTARRVVRSYAPARPDLSDPFSTKLPDTTAVFGILALYFVLVVPVSFLVLRKLKRGELAWITAPVLSLGFAGLLFKSAEGLYAAALSSATQGVLVLQEGSPDAVFYGTSQLFFPRGGVYDLKLEGVDSLNGVQQNEAYGYGYRGRANSDGLDGFNLVDIGEIKAPQLEANNLAFREMGYSQRVEANGWFVFRRIDEGSVRVENRSPYPFDGRLLDGAYAGAPFTLDPGGARVLPLRGGEEAPKGSMLSADDARVFTRENGRIALNGTIRGFRPGPQIGKEVEGRGGVSVLAFAQERMR